MPRPTGLQGALVTVLLLRGIASVPPATACGLYLPSTTFTQMTEPDAAVDRFLAGTLGILKPTMRPVFLYAAYRELAGPPLDDDERRVLTQVVSGSLPLTDGNREVFRWLPNAYGSYGNCLVDAYRTAERTRADRVARFGSDSREVKEWDYGQDLVFANCDRGRSIPPDAPPDIDPLIRADREYQIAAAYFYSGDFDAARERFVRIAGDAASPWSPIAPYLAARALTRKGTLVNEDDEIDRAALAEAETMVRSVLADESRAFIHPAARRLLGFVLFRLRPEERSRELAAALVRRHAADTLANDIVDYLRLPRDGNDDDLSVWLHVLGDETGDGARVARERWEKTGALTWLIAALARVEPDDPTVPTLLAAAADVPLASPAYLSVSFYRLRLLADCGRQVEARRGLDTLLSRSSEPLPESSRNLFLMLRAEVSTDVRDFLAHAARMPVSVEYADSSAWPRDPLFDDDTAFVLNTRLPLATLSVAAQGDVLPENLRRDVALVTWVRSVLLGDDASADIATGILAELAPRWRNDLEAYRGASDRDARRFAAAYLLLRLPVAAPYLEAGVGRMIAWDRIDSFRRNWWWQSTEEEPARWYRPGPWAGNGPFRLLGTNLDDGFPRFVSARDRAAARVDVDKILAVGNAPNFLARAVLPWAREHPDDPRVPEALHLVVRATRYGNGDDETGALSRQAFRLLHDRYPDGEWSHRTPYWFEAEPRQGTLQVSAPRRFELEAAGLPPGSQLLPDLVLWAWERPEDLRFLDPDRVGVAMLAKTIRVGDRAVVVRPQLNAVRVPPGTAIVAVARIEITTSDPPAAVHDRVATEIAALAAIPGVRAVQIDCDVRLSQRAWYRAVMRAIRERLPWNMPLSMTGLASWCLSDFWLGDVPVDEIVPMLFRMGPEGEAIRHSLEQGRDFVTDACRLSIGISTDEPGIARPSRRRLYVFNPRPWTAASVKALEVDATR
ncbi:MAG TPA: hypothetical protein VKU61_15950 [Candidatus Binatia bacterium]|nr:hypothetical protein [Candidatus Binatia bacterium]